MAKDLQSALQLALGAAYRVERELGGGGMSRVFVAEEVALGRRVAIKVLVSDVLSDASADRFRQEMQVAARLQHPAIVPVLGTGSADGLTWFTMPFIAGESLRARLSRQGALPVADVERYARDIFEALAAAHASGIVHRDIKPENLLLTDRHLAVADFGVARALSRSTVVDGASARLTGVGVAMGTPAYMAPEQALADESADHRVDLYAVGLVLYEMLHGAPPFTATTPQGLIAAHITTPPPDLRALRPDASPALLALTMQCLAKSPAERPATALAALEQLEREVPNAVPRAVPVARSRRWLVLSGVAAVVVVAAVALFTRDRAVHVGPKDLIVVGDFAHVAADSSLARALSQALRTDIGASSELRVPDAALTRNTLRAMQQPDSARLNGPVLVEMARRMGAKAYVEGRVDRAGAGFVFHAQLLAVGETNSLASVRKTARDSAGVLDAIDQLAREVREGAGESVAALAARTPLPMYTTQSLAALERVASGQQLIVQGRSPEAVELFRAATRLDSTFASAWRGLAVSLGNIGTRPGERFDALKRAFALREKLPENERLAIEGSWYAFIGDHERAGSSWRALAAADPEGTAAPNNLAIALQQQGRHSEARVVLAEALTRAPQSVTMRGNLQNAALEMGDTLLADSIAALPNARVEERFDALTVKRQYEAAYAIADSALRNPKGAGDLIGAAIDKARTAVVLGRVREARRVTQELLSTSDPRDATQFALGAAPAFATISVELFGDTARGVRDLEALLARYPLESLDPVAREYTSIASAFASLGKVDRAEALLSERDRTRPPEARGRDSSAVLLARSVIAVVRGRYDDARRLTHQSASELLVCREWCFGAMLARIHDRAGRPDSALIEIDRYLQVRGSRRLDGDVFDLAWALKRSGELYEARGDLQRAIVRYRELVQLWEQADPELQPVVRELKERIQRLEARRG